MAYNLDFEEIKKQHPIESVADRLGLELKKNGQQLRGQCFSGAEGERKLVITPAKGLWYSFALNEGGDVIKLVSLVNKVSPKEAAAWIAGETVPEKKPVTASSQERGERGFSPLTYLEPDHPAVEALGIEPEDAEQIGCGFAPRGTMKGTVAVPIRTDTGRLIGYLGITEAVLPKTWKF
ncbi:CHC2 zinc finger domain-containing protein [Sulfitobacter sp. M22298]|uniref:CHC2 zinc finger domain-containing protein n=1 Tax=Sulfitobacter sp. M22298 TaxID=3368575 RepID=UPI003745759B